MDGNIWILIFTLILAMFAFINARSDDKIKNDIKSNTTKLIDASDKLVEDLTKVNKEIKNSQKDAETTYAKVNANYNKTIENLEETRRLNILTNDNLKEIIAAKDATIEAQNEIISQITGGDTYVYFNVWNKKLELKIEGDYSIPELNCEIYFLENYLNIPYEECDKYLRIPVESEHIKKIFTGIPQKIYQNTNYPPIELPTEVLNSIVNNTGSGFDIYFNSSFNKWVQKIRIIENPLNPNILEVFSVIFEFKGVRNKQPWGTPNFKEVHMSEGYDKMFESIRQNGWDIHPIILMPKVQVIELKPDQIIQDLTYFEKNEFKQ